MQRMTGTGTSPTPQQGAVRVLSTELLNLISVGAATLMGAAPDPSWGQHDDASLAVRSAIDEAQTGCLTCRASEWFDAAQAELGRRDALPAVG